MSKKLLVISPHPDDEVLGAGGILLKAKKNGFKTKVLTISTKFPEPIIKKRIEKRQDITGRAEEYLPINLDLRFPDYILNKKKDLKDWIVD